MDQRTFSLLLIEYTILCRHVSALACTISYWDGLSGDLPAESCKWLDSFQALSRLWLIGRRRSGRKIRRLPTVRSVIRPIS